MSPPTAESLARRATGTFFLSFFGSGWLALWLAATQRLTLPTGICLGFALLALVVTAGWILRQTKPLRPQTLGPVAATQARRTGLLFGLVGTLEGGAIFWRAGSYPDSGFRCI